MKKLFIAIYLITSFSVSSQSKETIGKNIYKIEKALVEKDTFILRELLHSELTLGHSNGWIENRESLLSDLKRERVVYFLFDKVSEVEFTHLSDQMIVSRRGVNVCGSVDGYEFKVMLNILEIWIFEEDIWKLLARQSVNRKL